MANFLKYLKWFAVVVGWLWALIQFLTQHPFPPLPH